MKVLVAKQMLLNALKRMESISFSYFRFETTLKFNCKSDAKKGNVLREIQIFQDMPGVPLNLVFKFRTELKVY